MPRVEVTLPDRIDAQISNLVEQQDEFVSRDEAAEELLEMGLRAYEPEAASEEGVGMDAERMRGPEESGRGPGGGMGGPERGRGGPGEEGPGEGSGRR